MELYLRNICLFVCLSDFLAHLLASEKYLSIYKNVSGIFIILFLIIPFGKNVMQYVDRADGKLIEQFEKNMQNSEQMWDVDLKKQKADADRLLEYYLKELKIEENSIE